MNDALIESKCFLVSSMNNILKAVQNVSNISRKEPSNVENHTTLLTGDSHARGITEG